MITPLTEDGAIDLDGIQRLVAHLLVGGVSGIFVLGSSGEGPWLTPMQSQQVIEGVATAVNGQVPVLAGILEPSTQRVVEMLDMAERAGADAVVATTPYYFESDAAVHLHHFASIAWSTDLAVVLYNIPSKTHAHLSVETVAQLLEIENIVGIKDSSGDWEQLSGLLTLRQLRPDFRVLQGAEGLSGRSLLAGVDGLVPGLGNLMPSLFVRMVAAARAGDEATLHALQAQVDALGLLHSHGHWLACLKYAVSLLGLSREVASGRPHALSADAKQAIQTLVSQVRNAEIRPA
jgi:4-hydroxy-tetrahydrodipicolinate synthase